jgi:rRNA maturation protein Nop10
MKLIEFIHSNKKYSWRCKQWKCCGHIWQLLLSNRFPERYTWRPICPDCGRKGKLK